MPAFLKNLWPSCTAVRRGHVRRRTPTMASKSSEREGLSSAWRIASRLTFGSARSRRSFILIVLLFISLALANTAAVAQSFAQRDYMTALSQKQAALFFNKLGLAMVLLAATMPFRSLAEFAAGGLTIVWRDALTDGLLRDYFRPKVVYWLRHESLGSPMVPSYGCKGLLGPKRLRS